MYVRFTKPVRDSFGFISRRRCRAEPSAAAAAAAARREPAEGVCACVSSAASAGSAARL